MGDCAICFGPIFSLQAAPSSSQRQSSTPRPAGQVGEPLEISALPCGHVYHTGCATHWFQTHARNARTCPLCRTSCSADGQLRLRFTGDPWADERDAALKGSLGRAARRLAEKASKTLDVDSHERTVAGFAKNIEGALETVKEAAAGVKEEGGEEAWLALIDDPELKSALQSLAASLVTLNCKLQYSHRITSLSATVSELEAVALERSEELRIIEATSVKALKEFKAKIMDKVERERSRWKEKELVSEREWRGKEKSWEAKLALAEQRVREEVLEKKRLREEASSLDSSLNTRLSSLNSLKQSNAKLVSRLELAKQETAKLEARIASLEDTLALAQLPKPKRGPAPDAWDEDEMDHAGLDDSVEIYDQDADASEDFVHGGGRPGPSAGRNVTDDSLEITMKDISWQSEPAVYATNRTRRPFGQQPSKLSRLAATSSTASSVSSSFKPPPLQALPSANRPVPQSPRPSPQSPRPSSSSSAFTSGPRHKPAPTKAKPKPTVTVRAKVAEKGGQMRLDFGAGHGMQLALGERKRRKVDVVSGVL